MEVPSLSAAPAVDGDWDEAEWRDGLLLHGEFLLDDGSTADGVYPFVMAMGVHGDSLYAVVELDQVGPPFSHGESFYPDVIHMHFLTGHEGDLEPPADWVLGAHLRGYGKILSDGHWTGLEWREDRGGSGAPPRAQMSVAEADRVLTWEFAIARGVVDHTQDGLVLDGRTDFRMALRFERQDNPKEPGFDKHVDVWPGDGWTPDNHLDASMWLKLRIPE